MTVETMLREVRTEAKSLDPAKVAMTVVTAPFFLAGALLWWIARICWLIVAFGWSAGMVGWHRAGGAHLEVDEGTGSSHWEGGRKVRDG